MVMVVIVMDMIISVCAGSGIIVIRRNPVHVSQEFVNCFTDPADGSIAVHLIYAYVRKL